MLAQDLLRLQYVAAAARGMALLGHVHAPQRAHLVRGDEAALHVVYLQLVGVGVPRDQYLGALPVVGAEGQAVGVAAVEDGVVAAHGIGLGLKTRLLHVRAVWCQVLPLLLEDFRGDEFGGGVHLRICRACQPAHALFVEAVDVKILAPAEEVALHVLDEVFHFALSLGVRRHGVDRLVAGLKDVFGELLRLDVVAVVLADKHLPVLVVEHLAWHAAEELEREVVGVDGRLGGEGRVAEVHEPHARAAHYHAEEPHLDPPSACVGHPLLAPVDLGLLAILKLRELVHLAGRLDLLGDALFLADAHHIVVHGLLGHHRKIREVLLQMVQHLHARQERGVTQLLDDEVAVGVKLAAVTLCLLVKEIVEIGFAHRLIAVDCRTIYAQSQTYLALAVALSA